MTTTHTPATVRKSGDARFGSWFVQILGIDVEGFADREEAQAQATRINAKTAGMTDAEVRALYRIVTPP